MTNTYLKVDLDQVEKNIELVRKGKRACLMVKANNYGIGYDVIPELVKRGYDYFGVTTIEEADIIREYAPDAEILIVGYVDPSLYSHVIESNYTVTIFSFETLYTIIDGLKYHLKFDTGMGRIGFFIDQIEEVRNHIKNVSVYPIGIYSHYPEAINEEFTLNQIELFKNILKRFDDYNFEFIHLQNSVGCQLYDLDFCNLVRPGLSIWGYYADQTEKDYIESKCGETIKPALKLSAKVHMIKKYDGLIGYDLSEHVDGLIGTIRIGYHDGFSRRVNGYQFETGERVVGKVCMCQAFLKLQNEIDEIEVFGKTNSIYNLVDYAGLTVYELLVSISSRILREW